MQGMTPAPPEENPCCRTCQKGGWSSELRGGHLHGLAHILAQHGVVRERLAGHAKVPQRGSRKTLWKRRLKLFDLQIFVKVGAPWGGRGSAEDEISRPLCSRRRCGRSRAREARRTAEAQGCAQDTQFDIIDKVMDARLIFEIADERNFGELRTRRVDRVGLLLQ